MPDTQETATLILSCFPALHLNTPALVAVPLTAALIAQLLTDRVVDAVPLGAYAVADTVNSCGRVLLEAPAADERPDAPVLTTVDLIATGTVVRGYGVTDDGHVFELDAVDLRNTEWSRTRLPPAPDPHGRAS